MTASQRKRTNRIAKVCDGDGVFHTKQNEVGALFSSFYTNLFSTSNHQCIETCLQAISPFVFPSMNHKLLQDFNVSEIQQTVFKMNSL